MTTRTSRARPAPDAGILAGVVLAVIGYLLPWFQLGTRQWMYSGWRLLEEGAGWSSLSLLLLAVALVAGLWAGGHAAAAYASLAALVSGMAVTVLVLAATLVEGGVDEVGEITIGLGLILLVAGFGVAVAAAVAAISSIAAAAAVDMLRRRHFPN